MARPLRIEYEGALYHVTARGNARKPIFKDDEDRLIFFRVLIQVKRRYNWIYHAYCLMDNHYHLIAETPEANLSKGMRHVNGVYTQLFNKRHNQVGHLFQGRYKAILIDRENYLLEVCRYVVLNPVRAREVKRPEDWKWSSYRSTTGMERPEKFLSTDWILGQFNENRVQAQREYREFVMNGIGNESIWKEVKEQSFFGGKKFITGIKKYIGVDEKVKEIPRRQRYVGRLSLEDIFHDVKGEKSKRDQKILKAVEQYGFTQKEVAGYLGMHYSSISRMLKKVEKGTTPKFKT